MQGVKRSCNAAGKGFRCVDGNAGRDITNPEGILWCNHRQITQQRTHQNTAAAADTGTNRLRGPHNSLRLPRADHTIHKRADLNGRCSVWKNQYILDGDHSSLALDGNSPTAGKWQGPILGLDKLCSFLCCVDQGLNQQVMKSAPAGFLSQ